MSRARLSLFKHSNGVYYVLYYENGRRRWKSTGETTKPEALKILTRFRELLDEHSRSVPLKEFFARLLTYAETAYSPKSLELMRAVVRSFDSLFPRAYLSDITPEHIDRYKAKRLTEISPVSVHIELRTLRSIFNTARRWKLLNANVFDGVSLPHLPEQAPLALTVEDFQKLIVSIRETWLRELVTFAVSTGLRRGEILNLSNPRLRFHSLRHTFATNLIRAGVSLYEVQKLLGHSSVKVTEGYSHILSSELHAAVNKIGVSPN